MCSNFKIHDTFKNKPIVAVRVELVHAEKMQGWLLATHFTQHGHSDMDLKFWVIEKI